MMDPQKPGANFLQSTPSHCHTSSRYQPVNLVSFLADSLFLLVAHLGKCVESSNLEIDSYFLESSILGVFRPTEPCYVYSLLVLQTKRGVSKPYIFNFSPKNMSCGDRCNVSHLHLGKTFWNPISGQRTTKEKGQEEELWQKSSPMNGDDKGDKNIVFFNEQSSLYPQRYGLMV